MTVAPGVGSPDAVVFYGGAQDVFERLRPALQVIGGRPTHVGDDPGVPALYGMAVHDVMWGALNGFLHAAALLGSEGIAAGSFVERAGSSLSAILSVFAPVADEVDRGEYAADFGDLQHQLPSIDHLVEESQTRGVDDELPAYTRMLVARAVVAGHASESYSRIVDHFRKTLR